MTTKDLMTIKYIHMKLQEHYLIIVDILVSYLIVAGIHAIGEDYDAFLVLIEKA